MLYQNARVKDSLTLGRDTIVPRRDKASGRIIYLLSISTQQFRIVHSAMLSLKSVRVV